MTQRQRDWATTVGILAIIYALCFLIGYVTHAQEIEQDPQPCKIVAAGTLHEVSHALQPTFWVGEKINLGMGAVKYPPAITVDEASITYQLLKEFRGDIVEVCVRRPRRLARIVRW